jgi:hypothetical protein
VVAIGAGGGAEMDPGDRTTCPSFKEAEDGSSRFANFCEAGSRSYLLAASLFVWALQVTFRLTGKPYSKSRQANRSLAIETQLIDARSVILAEYF